MMISNEQARLVAKYLRMTDRIGPDGEHRPLGDEELVERVSAILSEAPDIREESIRRGRELLRSMPSSEDVAEKILGRLVSDSLR